MWGVVAGSMWWMVAESMWWVEAKNNAYFGLSAKSLSVGPSVAIFSLSPNKILLRHICWLKCVCGGKKLEEIVSNENVGPTKFHGVI